MSNLESKILAKHHIINTIDEELAKGYQVEITGRIEVDPNIIKQEYLWKRKEANQKKLQELMKRSKRLGLVF